MLSCADDKVIVIYNANTGNEEARFRGVSKSDDIDGVDTKILDAIFTRDNRFVIIKLNKYKRYYKARF